ncbi:hypothetical protein SPPR111872_14485 [Sphingobacterium prati]
MKNPRHPTIGTHKTAMLAHSTSRHTALYFFHLAEIKKRFLNKK